MTTLLQLAAAEFKSVLPRWIEWGIVSRRIYVDPWTVGCGFTVRIRCEAFREQQRVCMARLRAERAGKQFDGPKRIRNV